MTAPYRAEPMESVPRTEAIGRRRSGAGGTLRATSVKAVMAGTGAGGVRCRSRWRIPFACECRDIPSPGPTCRAPVFPTGNNRQHSSCRPRSPVPAAAPARAAVRIVEPTDAGRPGGGRGGQDARTTRNSRGAQWGRRDRVRGTALGGTARGGNAWRAAPPRLRSRSRRTSPAPMKPARVSGPRDPSAASPPRRPASRCRRPSTAPRRRPAARSRAHAPS